MVILQDELETLGRVWLRKAFRPDQVDRMARICGVGSFPGARLKVSKELLRILADCSVLAHCLASIDMDAAPVRLVAFNKTRSANWAVPWHQDRVIAVAEKADAPGYSNWVSKGAFWHCEPPLSLMRRMVFVRINIDACDESNGALELALGSHRHGRVAAGQAAGIASASGIEVCHAEPGDILVAKALVLHRSRSANIPEQRRALRLDYTNRRLLNSQLRWAYGA